MAKTASKGAGSRLRETQINPIPVIGAAVIIVGGLAYFFWLKPSMENDKIKKEWTSDAAAAARAPGSKPADPSHEAFLANMRQKNGVTRERTQRRRDDTE